MLVQESGGGIRNKVLAVLVISLGAVAAFFGIPGFASTVSTRYMAISGNYFEGETNGIWGYQVNGQASTVLGAPLPSASNGCSYAWNGPPTIASASVQACGSDRIDFADQTNPIPYVDYFSTTVKVNYYTLATNPPQQISGSVEVYTYTLNAGVEASSSGRWGFDGDAVWHNMASLVYNQAYSGQPDVAPTFSDEAGSVFEAPLYGVVTQVQWQNQADSQCNLCTVGQTLTFYTFGANQAPSTTGQTLATLAGPSNVADLNQTLYGCNCAPDSRMSSLVYYPLVINHMKNACGGFGLAGCNAPSVSITVKLYTLRVGKYILTNQDVTALRGFSAQCTGLACYINAISAFVNSPAGWITGLLAGGAAFILIIAIFATPVLVAIIYLIATRDRKRQA